MKVLFELLLLALAGIGWRQTAIDRRKGDLPPGDRLLLPFLALIPTGAAVAYGFLLLTSRT